MELLALIGGVVVVYWIFRVATRNSAAAAVRQLAHPNITRAHAICPDCGAEDDLIVHRAGKAWCPACATMFLRRSGRAPDLADLPDEVSVGRCIACGEERHVRRSDEWRMTVGAGHKGWRCIPCDTAVLEALVKASEQHD